MRPEDEEILGLLAKNKGFYNAENEYSKRVGKLVGYAGTYDTPNGPKQYVGTRYWNFPRGAERNPWVMDRFVGRAVAEIEKYCENGWISTPRIDCAFGCPEGGIIPAYEIARKYGCHFSRADKKVIELATAESREKSKLIFGRHTVELGWNVVIIEDVINNLSTTDKAIELVESAGATVVAIVCMINRSPDGTLFFEYKGRKINILQSVLIPTKEYQQDDPEVEEDIKNGNVVWKPKDNWDELVNSIRS